jgi:hypothetical protein
MVRQHKANRAHGMRTVRVLRILFCKPTNIRVHGAESRRHGPHNACQYQKPNAGKQDKNDLRQALGWVMKKGIRDAKIQQRVVDANTRQKVA